MRRNRFHDARPAQLSPLPRMSQYACIVADPPWPYDQADTLGGRQPKVNGELSSGVSSERRYGAMSIEDLCAMPVKKEAAKNAHLYLWTTNSFMVEAHEIARAWGFEPKTIVTWVKTRQEDGKPSMKMGYYYRGATEHCLFAVRGSLRLMGEAHPTCFLTPRPSAGHSAKPDYFYSMVEKQSPGPRLEIFARPVCDLWPKREGWHTYGNELPNDLALA